MSGARSIGPVSTLAARFRLSRTSANLLANYVGAGWTVLMAVVFVPVYIRFLGIEAYGLIGFFTAVEAALRVLDLGITPTVNRELARHPANAEGSDRIRDLVRSFEIIYWAVGIGLGVILALASPVIAANWLQAGRLPLRVVSGAIAVMGVVIALEWPVRYYQGGLMGLQRQAHLNGINILASSVRYAGAAVVLWRVSRSITAFFVWEAIAALGQVLLLHVLLWRSLPESHRVPRFSLKRIRSVWRFAAGMSAIAATALILTQLDKLILSRIVSLEVFGYYALAVSVARGLGMLAFPFFQALYPRFSELVALGDRRSLATLYHRGTQFLSVLLVPAGAVLAVFAVEVIRLWTGDAHTASVVGPIVSILVIGTVLNGLMHLPYALQLAHGWTTIGAMTNLVLVVAMVPAVIVFSQRYGALGAAAVWALLNLAYLAIGVPLTHRRLLTGEAKRWLVVDVGTPLAASMLVVVVTRTAIPGIPSPSGTALLLGAVSVMTLVAAWLATPGPRRWALGRLGVAQ